METIEKRAIISINSKKYDCEELKDVDRVNDLLLETLKPTGRFGFETEGLLRIQGKRISVIYNEDDKSGMSGTRSVISFVEDSREMIKIVRCGTVRSTLDIRIGEETKSRYMTSFFNFPLIVTGFSCVNSLTENGGEIKIDYLLNVPYTVRERTLIDISVRLCADED